MLNILHSYIVCTYMIQEKDKVVKDELILPAFFGIIGSKKQRARCWYDKSKIEPRI